VILRRQLFGSIKQKKTNQKSTKTELMASLNNYQGHGEHLLLMEDEPLLLDSYS